MPGITPSSITGYTSDGTTISFTLTALGITAAQANSTTGDFRIVLTAILRHSIKLIAGLATQPTFFTARTARALTGDRTQITHTVTSTYESNDAALSFPPDPAP